MSVEIRRGSERFIEREPGRLSRHAFSFGQHYDAERLAFGPLVCHDDHLLGRGAGFTEHEHRDLDIVTWVAQGTLVHTGADGEAVALPAGTAAVLRTGEGVRHSEIASDDGPCRFVQVWLAPRPDAEPEADAAGPGAAYAHAAIAAEPGTGSVPVASSADDAPLALGVPGARLHLARLGAHERLALPAAARVHAYLVSGALLRSSLAEPLAAGDAFLLVDEPAHEVVAAVPTELLVWSFEA